MDTMSQKPSCVPDRRRARGWAKAIPVAVLLTGCGTIHHASPPAAQENPDVATRRAIAAAWQQDHPDAGFLPDIVVSDGVVYLTGDLPLPQMRVELVRESWQPVAVREVIDELKVPSSADTTYARDMKLSMTLRARLTFDPDIQSTRYSIESVGGVVYLMGTAQSADESNKVRKLAGTIGASKVVNYITARNGAAEPAKS